MFLRAPHAFAECVVSSMSDGNSQRHPRPRLFLLGEDLLQRRKPEAKCTRLTRALPPLQQQRSPEAPQTAQSQLELLEKLTSGREKVDGDKSTIGEQLAKKAVVNTEDEVAIPLGKQIPLEYDDLTMAQKRNIRRQKYLDQVSKRNDAPFFAAIALFVVLPPAVILGVAVATGYINFLP
ncbi:hypothetical protein L7F22_000225 [Adiantum nelumboides]|nr:hypothetical protein [Adiantum nelumboides]